MSILRGQKTLSVLLCLAVLAGSTSLSIHHSHDHGRAPHSHGLGLVSWLATPATTRCPVEADGCACRHRHFVLLGIEFYNGEPSSNGPLDEARLSLEIAAGVTGGMKPDKTFRPADTFPSPVCLSIPAVAYVPPPHAHFSPRTPPVTRCGLCDSARGERSGTSLI